LKTVTEIYHWIQFLIGTADDENHNYNIVSKMNTLQTKGTLIICQKDKLIKITVEEMDI